MNKKLSKVIISLSKIQTLKKPLGLNFNFRNIKRKYLKFKEIILLNKDDNLVNNLSDNLADSLDDNLINNLIDNLEEKKIFGKRNEIIYNT